MVPKNGIYFCSARHLPTHIGICHFKSGHIFFPENALGDSPINSRIRVQRSTIFNLIKPSNAILRQVQWALQLPLRQLQWLQIIHASLMILRSSTAILCQSYIPEILIKPMMLTSVITLMQISLLETRFDSQKFVPETPGTRLTKIVMTLATRFVGTNAGLPLMFYYR